MGKNKIMRFLLLFSATFISIHLLYLVTQVLYGLLMSALYVPDIIDAYENVTLLSNEVTLGVIYVGHWWANPFTGFSFLASIFISFYIYKLKRRVQQ